MPDTESPPKPHATPSDLTSHWPDDAGLIEEAEAEAAEAEARAAAANARLRAIRLRQQAQAAETAPEPSEAVGADTDSDDSDQDSHQSRPAATASDDPPADAGELPDDETGNPRARKQKARRFRRPNRTTVAISVGLLCTAALLATSAFLVRHHDNILRQQQRAAEFTAAARQVVVTLMSINAASAKDDVQRILDSSTGPFRDDFRSAADEFIKAAQTAKVSTKTSVQAADVESMTDDAAVVLVAASSTLTNTTGAAEQPRSWRLSVKLAKDGGQIKMSSMEFIP